MTLCALADVKTLLDLSVSDTSQDAKLPLLIKRVSAQIAAELHYDPTYASIVSEPHAVNNRQLLQLNTQPIQAVTSITLDGVAITDYSREPQYDAVGQVYRGAGWCGNYYVRGIAYDPVAGFHSILVSYTGGWHLPGDSSYSEGAADSLPYGLYSAALQATLEAFNILESGGTGMQSHAEGKISDTFRADQGLSKAVLDMIAPYVRGVVA